MGLKSKICLGLAIVGACAMLGGMTGAITTGVLANEHQEKAFALLKADETYRLTTEFNAEKNEFEFITEKYVFGEISEIEYKISEMQFENTEKSYEDDLRNLESREHLQTLIKSVPKDEECAKEYEKSQKLGTAMVGCGFAAMGGVAAIIPLAVDEIRSIVNYRER